MAGSSRGLWVASDMEPIYAKNDERAGIEQGWESGCLNRTAWKEKMGNVIFRVTTAPPPTMAKSDVRRRRRRAGGQAGRQARQGKRHRQLIA